MRAARATLWILLYWGLVLAPPALLLLAPLPAPGGFWADLGAACGYLGLSMLGVQFILTARFRRASAPFGIDILYHFHRYVALVALALIAAHAALAAGVNLQTVRSWLRPNPGLLILEGLAALLLFAALVLASLRRKELRIAYGRWRLFHGPLAVAATILAVMHARGTGAYLGEARTRALWTLLMLSWPALLFYVRVLKPWRRARFPYRVSSLRQECRGTWTLSLKPEGHKGLRFVPGQFAWLTLGNSPYSIEEHPFSISSAPREDGSAEFTIKELGDFTRTIKDTPVGTRAFLDGPYGVFSASRYEDAPGFVFIAGGVGIAPMMSMLRAMADRSEKRPLFLLDGNKDLEGIPFREEIGRLGQRLRLNVVHVLNSPPADWRGETGFLTAEILSRHLPSEYREFEYFICGPTPMTQSAEDALSSLGVPLRRMHTELFDLV